MTMTAFSEFVIEQLDAYQNIGGDISSYVENIAQKWTECQFETLSLNKKNKKADDSLPDELVGTLLSACDCAIAASNSNDLDAVDNIFELASFVAVSQRCAAPLLQKALAYSSALLEHVRAAACRWIGFLVKALMKSSDNTNDMMDEASQGLLPRFTDKAQSVRNAAIFAAQFFFSATIDDPDIRQALTWSLQHDPSVTNRFEALRSLPLTPQTMDVFVSRVADVKPKVRVLALQRLQQAEPDIWTADDMATVLLMGWTNRYV